VKYDAGSKDGFKASPHVRPIVDTDVHWFDFWILQRVRKLLQYLRENFLLCLGGFWYISCLKPCQVPGNHL